MSLFDRLFSRVQDEERRFVVYRSDDVTDFEERLAVQGIRPDVRSLPPGVPEPFFVIEKDDEFTGAIGITEAGWLLEPPIVRPGERDEVSEGYRAFFEVLDDTMFSALERRQLLAVSREIEDRAYRVGTGTLHACFQTLSTFESQTDVYRSLATETDLDIHIHGLADWSPPAIDGITYHGFPEDTFERYWVLAFDGGVDERQPCGLLAEDTADGFSGFWTDDPETVTEIATELAG